MNDLFDISENQITIIERGTVKKDAIKTIVSIGLVSIITGVSMELIQSSRLKENKKIIDSSLEEEKYADDYIFKDIETGKFVNKHDIVKNKLFTPDYDLPVVTIIGEDNLKEEINRSKYFGNIDDPFKSRNRKINKLKKERLKNKRKERR